MPDARYATVSEATATEWVDSKTRFVSVRIPPRASKNLIDISLINLPTKDVAGSRRALHKKLQPTVK